MIRPASAFEIIPRGTALSAKSWAYARSRSRARPSSSAPTRLAARAKASAFTRALFHVKRYPQRQARTRAPRREGYERSAEPWARERSDDVSRETCRWPADRNRWWRRSDRSLGAPHGARAFHVEQSRNGCRENVTRTCGCPGALYAFHVKQ